MAAQLQVARVVLLHVDQIDGADDKRRNRAIAFVSRDARQLLKRPQDLLVACLADHGVLAVQLGHVGQRDEELAAPGVHVAGLMGHEQRAGLDGPVPQLRRNQLSVGTHARAVALRAAALEDEAGNHAVKRLAVVEPGAGQIEEVLDVVRGLVIGQVERDLPLVRDQDGVLARFDAKLRGKRPQPPVERPPFDPVRA